MKMRNPYSQKILILLISIFLLSLAMVNSANAAVSCTVKASCSGGEYDIFHMSATNNGHAEMPSQSNYGNKVCCSGAGLTGASCSGTYVVVLKLSSLTNAHAQQNSGSYSNNVCISATAGYSVGVTYGSCSGDYVCLASISDQLNGHVGDCSAYGTKVCVKVSALSELCSNGIDDDGDGLIDCEDPDCSQLNLDCVVPGSGSCTSRVWQGGGAGDCGRPPQNITCPDKDPVHNHTVCLSPHTCTPLEPTFGSFSVSPNSTTMTTGSFIISTVTTCPASLPGKCLVECKVDKPGGGDCITFDTWNKTGNARFAVTPDQLGVWNVSQCGIYTDFNNNLGWGTTNNAKKSICVHDGTGGWYDPDDTGPEDVCCVSNRRDLRNGNGIYDTCGSVGDCSTLDQTGCNAAPECAWCSNSGTCMAASEEECDGSATCNVGNTAKCNPTCKWEFCQGTERCLNGQCTTCGGYGNQGDCEGNPFCDWCPMCDLGPPITNKSTGDATNCVAATTCKPYACHKGNCSAQCSGDPDCGAHKTSNICYYNGDCNTTQTCSCSFDSKLCYAAGDKIGNICYYNPSGDPDCDNSGCHVVNCTLEQFEDCSPTSGCMCSLSNCEINGVCYRDILDSNPDDSCQICNVSEYRDRWTNITACIGGWYSDGCCPVGCSEDPGDSDYDYDCYLMRSHPLAYLFAHNITLMLGQGGIIKALVKNLQEKNDTITLTLTGNILGDPYLDLIGFMDSPGLNCDPGSGMKLCWISLNPYEKRKLFIRVLPSSETGYHDLHLNASSSLNTTLKDHDAARINVVYPSEFSELGWWAIIILMFFAVLIYSKMTRPGKNPAGRKIKNIERKK
jgi:hypothetical protein